MSVWWGLLALVPAIVAVARAALVVVTVTGMSMAPTLSDGDRVLVVRRWVRGVRRGDVVAARLTWSLDQPPATGSASWIIKRVAAVGGDAVPDKATSPGTVPRGSVFLLGDNAALSGDSRLWGALAVSDIVGVVVRVRPR
jgi:signal peptidase I